MPRRLPDENDRRHFIKTVSAFALTFAALPNSAACSARKFGEDHTPHPSRIDIAEQQEPGTCILLSGTVFDLSGKPVPQVKIFLYHTDAAGYYSRPVNNPRQARLHGTLWSNALGQYSVGTIKPAHYGDIGSPPPMHIHVHLQPPNLPDHWVDSFYFAGDPRLQPQDIARARDLERFSNIVSLTPGDAGVLTAIRDFRVDPAVAERNRLADGWYR